jgi:hypothetical protein
MVALPFASSAACAGMAITNNPNVVLLPLFAEYDYIGCMPGFHGLAPRDPSSPGHFGGILPANHRMAVEEALKRNVDFFQVARQKDAGDGHGWFLTNIRGPYIYMGDSQKCGQPCLDQSTKECGQFIRGGNYTWAVYAAPHAPKVTVVKASKLLLGGGSVAGIAMQYWHTVL